MTFNMARFYGLFVRAELASGLMREWGQIGQPGRFGLIRMPSWRTETASQQLEGVV